MKARKLRLIAPVSLRMAKRASRLQKREEQATFWVAPELGGMELLHATYITHTFSRHMHETFALGVIVEGGETFHYRGERQYAPQGRVVAVNPGEIHTGEAATGEGWTYRMFYPGVLLMRHIAHEITGRQWAMPIFPQAVIHDPELAAAMLRLHHALEGSPSALERATLLREAFGHLILTHAANRPAFADDERRGDLQAVERARAYLEAHYAENVTLDRLADVAGLSPFHLVRLFRRHVGLPPHAYQTHTRILRAKALLTTGMPIAVVAHELGFTDQSHLTRRFKGIVGVSPGQFAVAGLRT